MCLGSSWRGEVYSTLRLAPGIVAGGIGAKTAGAGVEREEEEENEKRLVWTPGDNSESGMEGRMDEGSQLHGSAWCLAW